MDIVWQEATSQRREKPEQSKLGRERRGGRPEGRERKKKASRVVWILVCFERRPDNQQQRAKHEHQHCILSTATILFYLLFFFYFIPDPIL
jgi:hypothetical protein